MKNTQMPVKILSASVALMVLMPMFASAQSSVTKTESVYVNTDATGSVVKEIVSDWLHSDVSGAVIQDQASLGGIRNIKGNEKPVVAGSNLTWKLDGTDVYYQGTTTKSLPVRINIHYYLDGKETAAKDLAGKSGQFEIRLSFTNLQSSSITVNGRSKTVYTPFLCAAGFNLPEDKFSNVKVNSGTVMHDGKNQIVCFAAVPGLSENFDMLGDYVNMPEELDLTADVQNFEFGPVMAYITPNIPGIDKLKNTSDASDLIAKLGQMADAAVKLRDGAETLSSGEQAFTDGIRQLFNGISSAGSSFDQIVSGAQTIGSAAGSQTSGIPALQSGAKALAGGAAQVSAGTSRLLSQFGSNASSPTLKDNVGLLNYAASSLLSQIDSANVNQSGTFVNGVNQVQQGAKQYSALANNTLFGIISSDLKTLYNAAGANYGTCVAGELDGLSKQAGTAVMAYKTAATAAAAQQYHDAAAVAVSMYDAYCVIATDPVLNALSQDDTTGREARFEEVMKSAATGSPSQLLYSFKKSDLDGSAFAALESTLSDDDVNSINSQIVAGINGSDVVLTGESVSAGTSALYDQLSQLQVNGKPTIYYLAKNIADGMSALSKQTVSSGDPTNPTLYDYVNELDSGAKQVSGGAAQLSAATSKLGDLQSGLSQLTGYLVKFQGGLKTIKGGTSTLLNNSEKLSDGSGALSSGISDFYDQAIRKLNGSAKGKLDEALQVKDEMIRLSDEYNTFSGTGVGIKSNVRFIVKVSEVDAASSASVTVSKPAAQAKAQNFFQKVAEWFRHLFHR